MSDGNLLLSLDPAQAQAVTAGDGLVQVVSGAGTGKTRVLTYRIASLIDKGMEPRQIFASTFSRKSAREMKERLGKLIGDVADQCWIGTLDSLAYQLLKRNAHHLGMDASQILISEPSESQALVLKAAKELRLLSPESEEGKLSSEDRKEVRALMAKIGLWKSNGIRPGGDYPKQLTAADRDAYQVYGLYQHALQAMKTLDFGDLCLLVNQLFETNPGIREQESSRCLAMLVDEFQDTSRAQLALLRHFTMVHRNIMVVGDDDQSLYSFRGAIPNLMEKVEAFFPEAAQKGLTRAALVTNRRCTDEILRPANMLVDYNTRSEPKVLQSGRQGDAVELHQFTTENTEAEWVAARIQALIAAGGKPEEIAVLGRTKRALEAISQVFTKRFIPHEMTVGSAFLERQEVQDVLAYLKLALLPSHELAFMSIAARPTRAVGAGAIQAVMSYITAHGLPVYEGLYALSEADGVRSDTREGARKLAEHLSNLASGVKAGSSSRDMLDYVILDMEYGAWALEQPDAPSASIKSSFDGLREMAAEHPVFTDFVVEVCLRNENQDEKASRGVHVGTLHGCKGLEWDHVFMVAFEEGVLPNERAMEDNRNSRLEAGSPWETAPSGGIEEERRLAHVGLTRGRQQVFVSHADQRKLNGKRQSAFPSSFVHEAELGPAQVHGSSLASNIGRKGLTPGKKRIKRASIW